VISPLREGDNSVVSLCKAFDDLMNYFGFSNFLAWPGVNDKNKEQ
jgi:hypothetical protein